MILRLAKDVLDETEAAADRHRLPRAPYVKLNPVLTLSLLNTAMLIFLVLMLSSVIYSKHATKAHCESTLVGETVSLQLHDGEVICASFMYSPPEGEVRKFQNKGKKNG